MRIKRKGENKPTHALSLLLGKRKQKNLGSCIVHHLLDNSFWCFWDGGDACTCSHLGYPILRTRTVTKNVEMLRYLCVCVANWLSSLFFYAISSGNIINFTPYCFRITAAGAFEQEILIKNSQIATLYIDWYTNGVFVLTLINKIHLI